MKVLIIGCSSLGAAMITTSAALLLKNNVIVVETIHYDKYHHEYVAIKSIPLEFIITPSMEFDTPIHTFEKSKEIFLTLNKKIIVPTSNRHYYHPLWTRPP